MINFQICLHCRRRLCFYCTVILCLPIPAPGSTTCCRLGKLLGGGSLYVTIESGSFPWACSADLPMFQAESESLLCHFTLLILCPLSLNSLFSTKCPTYPLPISLKNKHISGR